jgi:UDP-3-O-[3-hydroxymyristoyl] glucosamine N-acyltransferase
VTLGELAAQLGCQLEGDATLDIRRVATIDQAAAGDLTFVANTKYRSSLPSTQASAVILDPGVNGAPCAVLRSPNPYLSFAKAVGLLSPCSTPKPGIHATASVSPTVTIGEDVSIGAFAVIGEGATIGARTIIHPHVVIGSDVHLGPDCLIHARVSIRERSVLGARVVVQDGAVIGSDGFGFAPRGDGTHEKIPQTACVVIEDDVEIGANTTIDRPAVGETRIASGVKIDNLVQIAHGVVIGRNTLLAAQVGIAGSTIVGESVVLGGQVGVTGHVTVGDRVKASAKTGITGNVPADAFLSGYPSMDNLEWRKAFAVVRRLPEIRKQIKDLEQRLAQLEGRRV